MVPHDRRDRQEESNHDRNGGTSGTASACQHGAGCRPVRGLSYGSAVHRATVCARILCRAGAFPHHASPRNYDKLLISSIMTSNMLCKVQDL